MRQLSHDQCIALATCAKEAAIGDPGDVCAIAAAADEDGYMHVMYIRADEGGKRPTVVETFDTFGTRTDISVGGAPR